jgi:multidrug efflux pump
LEGVMAFPTNLPALPTSGFFPVSFVIKTTGSYEELYALGDKIKQALAKDWWLINVDSDLKYNQPQLNIEIDRDKASSLGVSMQDLSTTLGLALGEPTVTRFVRDGKTYEVVPQAFASNRNAPGDLYNFYVRTASQDLISLANLVRINPVVAPQSYNHFQQGRSLTLTASMVPGHTLGEALTRIKAVAEQVASQKGKYSFDYSDTSRQFMQASGTLQFALIFAVLFIFLVLSAQFESFLRPLIVMTSVPLALTGALLTLLLVGATLNIYTKIGLITLVGLITKHGILMVDFATRLQRDGLPVVDAIIKAASLRLRPILMTTSAMVLGAVPLILDGGAGSHARNQIGWVIVGGMSIGTLFTLFVVPSVYFLVYQWLANRKQAAAS